MTMLTPGDMAQWMRRIRMDVDMLMRRPQLGTGGGGTSVAGDALRITIDPVNLGFYLLTSDTSITADPDHPGLLLLTL